MEERVAVSVIIPVYNTEEYLPECLDSVLHQSFEDIEVLCVDDGSTDSSRAILEAYERNDRRVSVLSQGSGRSGPGAARNLAIERARGEYLAFVDSDDLIHRDFVLALHEKAEIDDTDVVMCTISKFSASGSREKYATCTYDRFISPELDRGSFTWRDLHDPFSLRFTSCNKLYRREFIDRHHIRYPEGIFFEDMPFTFRTLLQAERLSLVRQDLYLNRRQRPGATTFVQSDRVFGSLAAMGQLEAFLSRDPRYDELQERFAAFRFAKLADYLYKNDVDHIGRFYEALQAFADDPALDDNPYLNETQRKVLEVVRENSLLEYLVWDIWDTKIRLSKLRRQKARLRTQNRRLKHRMERAVLFKFEEDVRKALRPAVKAVKKL